MKSIKSLKKIPLYFIPKLSNKHCIPIFVDLPSPNPFVFTSFIHSTNSFWATIFQVCDLHWISSGELNAALIWKAHPASPEPAKAQISAITHPPAVERLFVTLFSLAPFCVHGENHQNLLPALSLSWHALSDHFTQSFSWSLFFQNSRLSEQPLNSMLSILLPESHFQDLSVHTPSRSLSIYADPINTFACVTPSLHCSYSFHRNSERWGRWALTNTHFLTFSNLNTNHLNSSWWQSGRS